MKVNNDPAMLERAATLRQMMNDHIRNLSPYQRDRILQIHLAQARGPARNLRLLCETTAMLFRARRLMRRVERLNGQERDL